MGGIKEGLMEDFRSGLRESNGDYPKLEMRRIYLRSSREREREREAGLEPQHENEPNFLLKKKEKRGILKRFSVKRKLCKSEGGGERNQVE